MARGKMIDYCIYVDPHHPERTAAGGEGDIDDSDDHAGGGDEEDVPPAVLRAIERVRRGQPGVSINHTDYRPLLRCPIAVSIESKTAGEQLLEAQLQVAV